VPLPLLLSIRRSNNTTNGVTSFKNNLVWLTRKFEFDMKERPASVVPAPVIPENMVYVTIAEQCMLVQHRDG
jgi:hypothetical protein